MATAAILRSKKGKIASYTNGLAATKQGWATNFKAETSFEEVYRLFIQSRRKEGIRPKTESIYEYQITKFFNWLQTERRRRFYQNVTHEDVESYVVTVNDSALRPASKHQVMRVLRTLFLWMRDNPSCTDLGLASHRDALPKKLKAVEGRLYIPSPKEVQQFMSAFDQSVIWGFRDYVMASVFLDTGARSGELCNMKVDDVFWDKAMLRLDGKTGQRVVPVSEDLLALLKKWLLARRQFATPGRSGADKLFLTRQGGECKPHTIGQEWRKHRLRTGIGTTTLGNLSQHTLRHYFCTYYLVNGGSIQSLQQITGHSQITTLMIYVHFASQITTVKTEHARVSPLKNLNSNSGEGQVKKRKMY